MQKIELNKLKNGPLWRWRYALIFSVYTFSCLLIFISVSKFLAKEINRSFGQPASETESVTTALDIPSYQHLAAKLRLATSTPDIQSAPDAPSATSTPVAPEPSATSTSATTSDQSITTTLPKKKPLIMIANSTKKPGLAGKLKTSLSAALEAEYKTSNLPPPLMRTVIRYKASLAPETLKSITQTVSNQYDPTIESAAADSPYDLEIIIGQK